MAQSKYTVAVPFPPSVNHYWRHIAIPMRNKATGKQSVRVQSLISAQGRKYKQAVRAEVKAQRANFGILASMRLVVVLYPPDRRKRDVDNYAKALLDGLTGAGVWDDDSQVRDLRLIWGKAIRGGKAIVHIRPMPTNTAQDGK